MGLKMFLRRSFRRHESSAVGTPGSLATRCAFPKHVMFHLRPKLINPHIMDIIQQPRNSDYVILKFSLVLFVKCLYY